MHNVQKEVAAAVFALVVASSAYWLLDQVGFIGYALPSVFDLGQAWFAVYFSMMGIIALFVLIGVGRVLSTSTWIYPGVFGISGLLLHLYSYNLSHAGWVAGMFGNGFYIMAAILYWVLPKNVTSRLNPTPKNGAV
ncbi:MULTISPECIES: hypothetical protein [unclassified Microbulbifer]|uniref:hypothetical protein n=1 Tax=unclassified Microbulbifer TaxID=2619833 RepID=UPI0027E3B3F0|nr:MULTISPECIES: hypothetical protein [unclassified Microbulbifer]